MGLTTAMYTGLTGLNSNQYRIDTIGNNVANVNTTAFKGSRANFQNQFSLMLSPGSGPSSTSGGTNPSQVGLGSMLAGVQRSFLPGAIETTGVPTDMAIEGAGFFIVRDTNGGQAYTRDGTFKVSSNQELVNGSGYKVQGYGVDSDFNIIPGALGNLSVPIGTLSTARASRNVKLDGNLNADGTVATQGTILMSQAFLTGSSVGPAATGTSLLADLYDSTAVTPLFAEGDVITVRSAKKGANGGRELPEESFTVTAGSTLGDYAAFLNNALAINADPALGGTPGVRIGDTAPDEGRLIIEGNPGRENALAIELADIISTNVDHPNLFQFTRTQDADGESVYTSFIVYDSLGSAVRVNLTMTLESKSDAGNTWRFMADSPDDTSGGPVLGTTGTVTFDNDGMMVDVRGNTLQIDRQATGAVTPLQIQLDFFGVTGLAAPYSAQPSMLVMTTQDGYAAGTLSSFAVGPNGKIIGTFTNGLTRDLGQIALATFTNAEGLVADVNNLYRVGPNSGQPMMTAPQTLGAGSVLSGALELSNVDLTREFIGLITATTGFSAAGRVISTSNDLLNELLMIAR
ncbi:MAG TPA: flagellar hook-basal body complex protein [Phycisphaerae bacterium]|nr:flagellar hook-basal body complex protein [Phycisphaerae bacterium]